MNISIIEFAVYAFVGYSSLLMLIISITKEGPLTKSRTGTLIKSIYIIPGIYCMTLLSGSGVEIFLDGGSTVVTNIYNATSGALITNSTVIAPPEKIVLQNPIWVPLHYMFTLIMFAYVIINVLKMFSAKE